MTATKTPTASGISRLLASAGHARAVVKMRGGRSGYKVTEDYMDRRRVRVRHQFWAMGGQSDERYRAELDRYAKTITEAGWTVEAGTYELIVTAKEGD